jgi:monolysocardiolipin acyltransferase
VLNSTVVHNRDRLISALHDRPSGVPLLTVSNHHSCMDEPLIWGMLDFRQLLNAPLMRWALAAHDICFSNRAYANYFALGKSVPIVRGDGVYQVKCSLLFARMCYFHIIYI